MYYIFYLHRTPGFDVQPDSTLHDLSLNLSLEDCNNPLYSNLSGMRSESHPTNQGRPFDSADLSNSLTYLCFNSRPHNSTADANYTNRREMLHRLNDPTRPGSGIPGDIFNNYTTGMQLIDLNQNCEMGDPFSPPSYDEEPIWVPRKISSPKGGASRHVITKWP